MNDVEIACSTHFGSTPVPGLPRGLRSAHAGAHGGHRVPPGRGVVPAQPARVLRRASRLVAVGGGRASPLPVLCLLTGWFASSCVSDSDHRLPARCRERASLTGTPPSQWCCRSGNAGPPVGTARRRRAESRIATHRDSSRPGAVPIPGGGVPAPGRASTQSALRRSPRFAGLCRPEVYTFPGITFSWGRHLANERRRTGCVGARQVAGRRRPEEEGGLTVG